MAFEHRGVIEMSKSALALGTAFVALVAGTAQAATELRFTCYGDANECEVMREQLDKFEAQNSDIKVTIDKVAYKAILESLPVQLAAGEGPDLARVTDLGGLSKYFLDLSPYVDAAYWEENFGSSLKWFRSSPGDKGIYGMMTQLTVTGPYVNKTLFEQAGVALPGEKATFDEWAEAARQVAKATETKFPMAMDRSGHRLAGPAISEGAKYFDAEGKPAVVDDGFRRMITKFVAWNQDGTMAKDVWGGSGGSAYQDAAQEFINGQLVYYFSGSWQVGRFEQNIGDAFDWEVVPPPCGPGGCTGMPGGAGLVGIKTTQHPEAVAKVIDYFASEPVHAELMSKTKNVPAHKGLAAKGLDYPDATPAGAEALKAWGRQVGGISPVAYALQGYPNNRAIFNITVQRVTQAIVGELTTEQALERIAADMAEVK
jgi:alpha-1,4-digalacturonate transport system substrate-binding protein